MGQTRGCGAGRIKRKREGAQVLEEAHTHAHTRKHAHTPTHTKETGKGSVAPF